MAPLSREGDPYPGALSGIGELNTPISTPQQVPHPARQGNTLAGLPPRTSAYSVCIAGHNGNHGRILGTWPEWKWRVGSRRWNVSREALRDSTYEAFALEGIHGPPFAEVVQLPPVEGSHDLIQ